MRNHPQQSSLVNPKWIKSSLNERSSWVMIDLEKLPKEAIQALGIIKELLGSTVVGVYLHGSAVMGACASE